MGKIPHAEEVTGREKETKETLEGEHVYRAAKAMR